MDQEIVRGVRTSSRTGERGDEPAVRDFEEARSLRAQLRADVTELVLDAGDDQWTRVRTHIERVRSNLDRVEMDHAWLLELVGDIADDAGQIEITAIARAHARALWAQLGNDAAVRRVGRKSPASDMQPERDNDADD